MTTTTEVTSTKITKLSELNKEHIGNYVQLYGWVYSTRIQGAGTLVFIDLGDGTTVTPIRCLATKQPEEEGEEVKNPYGCTNFDSANNSDEIKHYNKLNTFDDLTITSNLCIGCSIVLYGYVSEPPTGTTQVFEIHIIQLYIIGGVEYATKYPIQKSILKKPLSLRSQYHARFRAPLIQQIMKIRSETLYAIHEFFHNENVPLLDPNIMTSSDCEGAGEIFKITPQFFSSTIKEESTVPKKKDKKKNKNKNTEEEGKDDKQEEEEAPKEEAVASAETSPPELTTEETESTSANKVLEVGLTVSSQLPLEAIAMGTKSVYTCQKSFRAEKSDTNKHLAEFLHVEYEEYFITFDDLLNQAERYIKHVIKTVLERCQEQYKFLNNKNFSPIEFHGHGDYLHSLLDKPFIRLKHSDAIDIMLDDLKNKVKYINEQGKEVKLKFKEKPTQGEDLGSEHEKYLVQKFGTFVFITHWPSNIKSFYMYQVGDGTCESFDLLAPIVGELFGGSMREWRYDILNDVMKQRNMDITPLQWFVNLRKDGTAPHGGWGMGFDRLVMFLTNAASVRDVVPYPVYYGHCPY